MTETSERPAAQFSPEQFSADAQRTPSWFLTLEQGLALAAVVALAVLLRLTFVTGMVHSDDLAYAKAAHAFAIQGLHLTPGSHDLSLEAGLGRSRLTMYVPVGTLYWLFGVSDVTTLAWPFLCSLLTVVLVYGVSRLLAGESAGLLAAFVWAVLPLDISLATSLLPDGPVAMFCTAAVLAFLLADRSHGFRAVAWYVGCAICLALAAFAKQTGLITCLFFFAYLVWKRRFGWKSFAIGAGLLCVAAALVAYHYRFAGMWPAPPRGQSGFTLDMLAGTATDWYRALSQAPEFFALLPLFAVAASVCLGLRLPGAAVAFVWLATTFLYMELGTRNPFAYVPWKPEALLRQLTFVIVPCAVLSGIYLGHCVRARAARGIVCVAAAALAGTVWFEARGLPTLPAWVLREAETTRPFATVSTLAAALTIFGCMTSPLFVVGSRRVVSVIGITLLMIILGVATLNPTLNLVTAYRMPWVENTREVVTFLRTQTDYPWLAQTDFLELRLAYESGFSRDSRLQRVPAELSQIGNAYIITDDFVAGSAGGDLRGSVPDYMAAPAPPTWWEIATFGKLQGYQTRIYRVLTGPDAERELAAARLEAVKRPGRDAERRLAGAEVNAGQHCAAAFRALRDGARTESTDAMAGIVPVLTACYAAKPTIAGPNLFHNGDFSKGLEGWSQPHAPVEFRVEPPEKDSPRALKVHVSEEGQHAVLLQGFSVKPDTPYVYEMEVKSAGPVVALYYDSDVGRFLSERPFPGWNKVQWIFITPHWDGRPRYADFHPFLAKGKGDVWLRNVRMSELRPEID